MPNTSYKNLTVNVGELKFLTALSATAANGVTQDDLDAAETYARDRINLWIVRIAGRVNGAAIISEFLGADLPDIDPAVSQLAGLLASARILRLMEERNLINDGTRQGDQLRRKDWEIITEEAVNLGKEIERARVTIKADGTVRSWGMSNLGQGPVVSGPMRSGSLFDDSGLYTDNLGRTFPLPHRNPADEGS